MRWIDRTYLNITTLDALAEGSDENLLLPICQTTHRLWRWLVCHLVDNGTSLGGCCLKWFEERCLWFDRRLVRESGKGRS
jgi:hypothetical protein